MAVTQFPERFKDRYWQMLLYEIQDLHSRHPLWYDHEDRSTHSCKYKICKRCGGSWNVAQFRSHIHYMARKNMKFEVCPLCSRSRIIVTSQNGRTKIHWKNDSNVPPLYGPSSSHTEDPHFSFDSDPYPWPEEKKPKKEESSSAPEMPIPDPDFRDDDPNRFITMNEYLERQLEEVFQRKLAEGSTDMEEKFKPGVPDKEGVEDYGLEAGRCYTEDEQRELAPGLLSMELEGEFESESLSFVICDVQMKTNFEEGVLREALDDLVTSNMERMFGLRWHNAIGSVVEFKGVEMGDGSYLVFLETDELENRPLRRGNYPAAKEIEDFAYEQISFGDVADQIVNYRPDRMTKKELQDAVWKIYHRGHLEDDRTWYQFAVEAGCGDWIEGNLQSRIVNALWHSAPVPSGPEISVMDDYSERLAFEKRLQKDDAEVYSLLIERHRAVFDEYFEGVYCERDQ